MSKEFSVNETTAREMDRAGFRYDVFLCHNRHERPRVKDLADALQLEAGVLFFLDEYSIPAGAEFLAFIRDEMSRSASCAIILGPAGWGPTHLEEARMALDVKSTRQSFRIIPVTLPGSRQADWGDLFGVGATPSYNWVEISDLADGSALEKLIEAVQGTFRTRASGPEAITPYYIRRQAALWEKSSGKENSLLLRGKVLAEAQRQAGTNPGFVSVNAVPAYLARSSEAERNRLRIWLGVLGAAFLTVVLLGILVWVQRDRALRAQSRFLAAQALAQVEAGDATTGLLIALEALPKNLRWPSRPYVAAAEQALYTAYANSYELYNVKGHYPWARRVALSPDGRWLASTGGGRVKLFSITDQREVDGPIAPDAEIIALRFDQNGKLITVSDTGEVTVTEPAGPSLRLDFSIPGEKLSIAQLSPDGRTALAGTSTGRVVQWDVESGPSSRSQIADQPGSISFVAFSGDCKMAAFGAGRQIKVWETATKRTVREIVSDTDLGTAGDLSADARFVAAAGDDHKIRFWSVASPEIRPVTLEGHQGDIWDLRFGPRNRLLSTSADHSARIWSCEDPSSFLSLDGHTDEVVRGAFSNDGSLVATASNDQTARLWRASDGKALATLRGHSQRLLDLCFSADDGLVATGSADKSARLWQTRSNIKSEIVSPGLGPLKEVSFNLDGTRLLILSGSGSLSLRDGMSGTEIAPLEGASGNAVRACFSPDGLLVAAAARDGKIRTWYSASGKLAHVYEGHRGAVRDLAFHPDGSRFVSGGRDGTVRLWNVGEFTHITLGQHSGLIESVAFDSRGTRVISAGPEGTRVWTLASHGERVLSSGGARWARFGHGDRRAIIRNEDNRIELWDLDNWHLIADFGHGILSASLTRDRERVLLASFDGNGAVYQARDGSLATTLLGHGVTVNDPNVGEQRLGAVMSIAEAWPGGKLVTTSDDKTARVWDAETGDPLMTLAEHRDSVDAAAVRPDGQAIATVSRDGTLILTPLFPSTQALIDAARSRKSRQLDECARSEFFISSRPAAETCLPLPER